MITVFLLEGANVGQLWRMWTEGTAEGQSLTAWILISAALILWLNFYRVCTPEQKWAIRATVLGIVMNAAVIATVLVHRFIL